MLREGSFFGVSTFYAFCLRTGVCFLGEAALLGVDFFWGEDFFETILGVFILTYLTGVLVGVFLIYLECFNFSISEACFI